MGLASLVAQTVNNPLAMWETWVRPVDWGRSPGGGHGNPLKYSCLENLHGQRSLADYSPRGDKESETTELLSTAHTSYTWDALLVAQMIKNLPLMQEIWVQSLVQEHSLQKGMATHSSILAWRIPWIKEPGGLQSMGLQRVEHNSAQHSSDIIILSL